MTPSREDYLKSIYTANQSGIRVTNKMIAHDLHLSPPSVSEMINKLMEEGKITKDDDKGYRLTTHGQRDAQQVLRKHRLWEVFLVDYLGYAWDEVHDDAEVLEHATSDSLADRLNDFLKHPQHCPHGSIIFGNAQEFVQKPLTQFTVGDKVEISAFSDDRKFLQYVKTKGIQISTILEVVAIDPFDQTYECLMDNNLVVISQLAAKEIFGYTKEEGNV